MFGKSFLLLEAVFIPHKSETSTNKQTKKWNRHRIKKKKVRCNIIYRAYLLSIFYTCTHTIDTDIVQNVDYKILRHLTALRNDWQSLSSHSRHHVKTLLTALHEKKSFHHIAYQPFHHPHALQGTVCAQKSFFFFFSGWVIHFNCEINIKSLISCLHCAHRVTQLLPCMVCVGMTLHKWIHYYQ